MATFVTDTQVHQCTLKLKAISGRLKAEGTRLIHLKSLKLSALSLLLIKNV